VAAVIRQTRGHINFALFSMRSINQVSRIPLE
jgi:hypothetical protein